MSKTAITLTVIGVGLFLLAWYFGFLDFISIKGGSCNSGGGNFVYGKCIPSGSTTRTQTPVNGGSDNNNNTIIIVEPVPNPQPQPKPQPSPSVCDKELAEAQTQFSQSKKVCIELAVSMKCPKDNNIRTTNPCVANILEGKGWTKVS